MIFLIFPEYIELCIFIIWNKEIARKIFPEILAVRHQVLGISKILPIVDLEIITHLHQSKSSYILLKIEKKRK